MTVAEVHAVAQAFHEGVANRDAAALARLYHEDARLLMPDMEPAEGRSAIQATFQQQLDMGVRSLDVEPLDVREGGDLTTEYGRYTIGVQPGEADGFSVVGKYVVVYETREDGSTKILLDSVSFNAPLSS